MSENARLKREKLAKNIYAQLNNFVDLENTLSTIIKGIKELTEVEAISIRLYEDGDFPFLVSAGFSKDFIQHENSIAETKTLSFGDNNNHAPQLDCLCGKVISGNTNSLKDYYTDKGSYWTNNSTEMTPILLKDENDVHIRNHCNACGYESVGLFPIKTRTENIGLIQLNDKKEGVFTDDLIEFMEMVGEQIGIAVENAILYKKLRDKNTELENSLNLLNNMQDQLLESKKMTALADMVSGIAHEIYNPISKALTSSAQALEIAYSLAEKDTGYKDEINGLSVENKKALKNIEEVKDLIKSFKAIAIDQFHESRQLINLNSFITDVIRVNKPLLKNIDIHFNTKCKENIEIMTLSGALSQILSNLISNSYHHGFKEKKSGEISIDCKLLLNDTIELIFADNGKGLTADTKHKIFEPFFTTNKKEHSGLGLTIVKNLLNNKFRGNIEVNLAVDEGVEFRIQIPI